jgi:hypothetical protein
MLVALADLALGHGIRAVAGRDLRLVTAGLTARDPHGWVTRWKLGPIFSTNHGGTCSRIATSSVTVNGSFEPAVSLRSRTIESCCCVLAATVRMDQPNCALHSELDVRACS